VPILGLLSPLSRLLKATTQDPSTFLVLWADWQLGKSASGGVKATVNVFWNLLTKLLNVLMNLKRMVEILKQIAFVNMGDPIEGCSEFYSSQTFSVQLTQREQLLLL
jgi:hypothetical protein